MSRAGAVAIAAGAVLAGSAGPVRADDAGPLHALAALARARVDAALAQAPVQIAWKAQRLGSLDVGAPVLALAGADLDGDGRAELYAVTGREVVAIGVDSGGRVAVRGRVAFPSEPAAAPPRDEVGIAVVDGAGAAVRARVASAAKGLRVTWRGGQLVGDPDGAGFATCAGDRDHDQLAPGRNVFGAGPAASYGARCATAVDAGGAPLAVRGDLAVSGKLDVVVARCAVGGGACAEAARYQLADVGFAYAFADVDRDGRPEAIFAAASAPGDPDTVKVVTLGDDPRRPRLKKTFAAGGVAGIAVADVDGDHVLDVIAAVRLVGASRVDLWRLD